jgi:hypothetical protein
MVMKLVNSKLQTRIEYLSSHNNATQFFKEYLQSIIEDTSKPYHKRADYVGLSLQELQSKIDTLSTDIKELQQLKKKLSHSLDMAKEITADLFIQNGIDRIDGTIISSLTLTKPTTKTQQSVEIIDHNAVMGLGYIKYEPDTAAIEQAMATKEGIKKLGAYVSVSSTTVTTPAKIKVNTKRTQSTQPADELSCDVQEAA